MVVSHRERGESFATLGFVFDNFLAVLPAPPVADGWRRLSSSVVAGWFTNQFDLSLESFARAIWPCRSGRCFSNTH